MDERMKGIEDVLAESLAALEQGEGLEAVLARYPAEAEELKALLGAAVTMKSAQAGVEPRPGFVAASKGRLLAQIAAETAGDIPLGPLERLSLWWQGLFGGSRRYALQAAVILMMLACLVLGSSGIAYASQGALPGDSLYRVKVGLEEVQLLVNLDPVEEVRLHMQFTQRRLAEIEELVNQGRHQNLRQVMLDYEYHIDQATILLTRLAATDPQRAGSLALEMKQRMAQQSQRLTALIVLVPPEVAPEVVRGIAVVTTGDRTLQILVIQTGASPTETPVLPGVVLPSDTSTPLAATSTATSQLGQAPTATATPTPTLAVTASSTATLVVPSPTSTLRFSSPTPTTFNVQVPPTETPVPTLEPTAVPEPTDKPHPNPTRRPPHPGDDSKSKAKSSKK